MSDLKIEINKTIRLKQSKIKGLMPIPDKMNNITNARQITRIINGEFIYFSGNSVFEGFKSSGKIAFIEDSSLRNAILKYYQDWLPAVNTAKERMEESKKKMLYEVNSHPESFIGTKLYGYLYRDYLTWYNAYLMTSREYIEGGKDIVNQIKKLEK